MADIDALAEYERFDFTDPAGRWTRPVWRRGSGPAVIVIHEMPGLHPQVIRFADRVAAAGMTVFLPSLFGAPGKPVSRGYAVASMLATICIRREFSVWAADRSSPIVDWLRTLAAHAHRQCGGRGVGAVGMCFTGGYALAMMTEPAVVAPVLSQPSMPPGKGKVAALDVTPAEIACAKRRFAEEDLSMIALRFEGDPLVPPERFQTLEREFGSAVETIVVPAKDGLQGTHMAPHSVLTIHLVEDSKGPTKQAEQRVIAFFKEKTSFPERTGFVEPTPG